MKRSRSEARIAGDVREFVFQGESTRLDQAIATALPNVSRGLARRLIGAGSVFLDGRRCRIASRTVRAGERVRVVVAEAGAAPELRVLHEDDDVIVVDKPAGMPTAPTRRAAAGTAHEAVRRALHGRGDRVARLWTVHRLDAATSGVVVFARSAGAARALSQAFRDQLVEKRYVALVAGRVAEEEGRIDAPIEASRGRSTVSTSGKPASTSWKVRARAEGTTLVELVPRTGRMHQLRVHMADAGHPIVGDRLFGGGTAARLMLHAESLRFPHPRSGEPVAVHAPPPAELRAGAAQRDGASLESRATLP